MLANGCVRTRAGSVIKRTENLPALDALTAHLWFKVLTVERTWQTLFIIHDGTISPAYRVLHIHNIAGTPYFRAVMNGETIINYDMTALVGQWLYCALTCVGSGIGDCTAYLYNASGTQLATGSNASPTANFTPAAMELGAFDLYPQEWLNGYHAAPRIWDAVLSQTQIEDEQFSREWVTQTAQNCGYNDDPCQPSGVQDRRWITSGAELVSAEDSGEQIVVAEVNSTNDYLFDIGVGDNPAWGNVSMSAWVRLVDPIVGFKAFELRDASNDSIAIERYYTTEMLWGLWYAQSGFAPFATTQPPDDDWFYISITHNNTNAVARWWYKDGTLGDSVTQAYSYATSSYETIVAKTNSTQDRPVQMCRFRQWQDILTQSEFEDELAGGDTIVNTTNIWRAWNHDGETDDSGSGRPLAEGGSSTIEYPTVAGPNSTEGQGPPLGSLESPGGTAKVYRTTNLPTSFDNFTVTFWAKWLVDQTQDFETAFSLVDSGNANAINVQFKGTNDQLRLGNESGNVLAYEPIVTGVWYFIAARNVTAGANLMDLAIWNSVGRFLGRGWHAGVDSTPVQISVFNYFANDEPFIGRIAYLRAFRALLTDAQIEAEMVSPTWVYGGVRDSGFSGGNPSAPDNSGNVRDWTVSGAIVGHRDEPDLSLIESVQPPIWIPNSAARYVEVGPA